MTSPQRRVSGYPRPAAWALALSLAWFTTAPLNAQAVVDLVMEDRPLTGSFEELFRVGGIDAGEWAAFGSIDGTAFDAAGNLYVFDEMLSRITVVDARGVFVRTVGRPGQGPGEFRMPLGFTVLADGRVVVSDLALRGYQVFLPDGSLDRIVSMGDLLRVGRLQADPRGGAVYAGGALIPLGFSSGRSTAGDPSARRTRPVERVTVDGAKTSTEVVARGWMPPEGTAPTVAPGGMRVVTEAALPRLFEPELLFGPLPDGTVALSDSSAYAVKVTGPDGAVRRVIRRPFHAEPLTQGIQEAERRRRLAEFDEETGGRAPDPGPGALGKSSIREMVRDQLEQLQFYEEIPVLMDLKTSWDGKIWVLRRGPEPNEAGPVDVLTPSGQYVGTLAPGSVGMPDSFGPDGVAAFIQTDDLGVRTVVVRRIPAALR